ncbi:hypothetical protein KRMM14A1259_54870 [Krasilnikovia sp. MM14-A1259]
MPTPPRSRYAYVAASAVVGAGVVAMGAGANFPDAKAVNPTVLHNLENASSASSQLADRAADPGRASRGEQRGADKAVKAEANAEDVWLLPLDEYTFTSPYGIRFGKLHAGIDLAAPEGVPYKAIHGGTVTSAGYNGAYGYAITIKNPDGTETIYGHSRRVLVKTGDVVKAGQVIGEVGNTGYSYGTHLHLEIHVHGNPTDPITFLRDRGVDIKLQVESVYAGMAASEAS